MSEIDNVLEALPRLACGAVAYPGRMIARDYLGNTWEARIRYVGDSTIDIQYTNQGTHAARGHVSRLNDPKAWSAIENFEKSSPIP